MLVSTYGTKYTQGDYAAHQRALRNLPSVVAREQPNPRISIRRPFTRFEIMGSRTASTFASASFAITQTSVTCATHRRLRYRAPPQSECRLSLRLLSKCGQRLATLPINSDWAIFPFQSLLGSLCAFRRAL
jgi:hypothetical protein